MRNVSPSLLSKLNSQQQTKANDANPIMNVYMARARSTISDSAYWTVETIRESTGLGDVSLAPRRFKINGAPNRIYEIHVKDGIVKTSIREYPDKLKDGFIDQFTLGTGSSVAIAFDGHWERYRDSWRLITDEKPWIFWVDGSNKLWTQLWDDVSTKLELSTDVNYVRAIRAWKNLNIEDHDQGVLVGYIKSNGKVYYRNYCEYIDGTFAWETERELTDFTDSAVSLNLFITNDYRMGFSIEDSTQDIHWLITERNWAGMALKQEKITLALNASVDLKAITYYQAYNRETITMGASLADVLRGYALTDNMFMEVYNLESEGDYGQLVEFTIKEPLVGAVVTDFILTDARSTIHYPLTLTKQTHYKYLLEFENLNNAGALATLEFVGDATNALGVSYDGFEKDFVPVGLVPTALYPPEVEAIWNE